MKSIRARLTLALIVGGAALLAVLCAAVHSRARTLLTAQFDDGLRARSAAIVSLLRPEGNAVELDYKDEYMPEYESPEGGFAFQVWVGDNASHVLERSRSLHGDDLPRFGDDARAPEFRDFAGPGGRPWRAAGLRAAVREDEDDSEAGRSPVAAQPIAVVVVAGDTSALHARLRSLAVELLGGGVLGLAALALVIRIALRRGLAPLAAVSDHAARLDASSLHQPFPTKGLPSELAPICARLNDLLARIEDAFNRERRFSADVAHELRTPIAELRTLSEVGASLIASSSANGDVAAFFRDAGDISTRMEGTVSTLLTLARCESGNQHVQLASTKLANALEPVLEWAKAAAGQRGIHFECSLPPNLAVETDRELLARLFRILLENAVEYTPPNGAVIVKANESSVTIENGPVVLEPADLPHLFERFWRKDSSRTDSRHAGLGLALAAELARLLGIRIAPELSSDRTYRLTVRIETATKTPDPAEPLSSQRARSG